MDAERKRELEEKVYAGERLGREDGEALYGSDDLVWLGRLAHHRRTGANGRRVLFPPVTPPTGDQPDEPRVVSGPTAGTSWDRYLESLRELNRELPEARFTAIAPAGIDEPRHRLDHLLRLRELQDETGVLVAFNPQGRRHDPAGDRTGDRPPAGTTETSPAELLRTFAVSRLLFDNVPHVACGLATHGPSLAQLSFNFGVDALDDVPGTTQPEELLNLIWDAGFQPVERDAHWRVVREYDAPASLAQRRSEPQKVWA
jgi:aminodeoxyfutalosine synthase